MPQPILTFTNVTFGYDGHPAIHHLSGQLAGGSMTAVLGANGSGKSTLLKGAVGLLKPLDGAIALSDSVRTAYLPQRSEIDRSFPARVVDLVSLGLWPSRGLLGRHTAEDRKRVAEAIAAVGLSGFETRPIETLSGGQFQRALFARVMLQDAGLILLDEPFNAIDAKTVGDLVRLIERWHGESRTVMVVAHDLELVRSHFPEALLLARQCVAWGDTRDTLKPENLLKARRFHEAWEDDAPWCEPGEEAHDHGTPGHDHSGHAHAHGHIHDGHHDHGPRAA